jgi:hypothetical protein
VVVVMAVPLALAGLWTVSVIAVAFIAIREIITARRDTPRTPPGIRRFAPDPAFDPAIAEDEQVRDLDALYYAPSGTPRAW